MTGKNCTPGMTMAGAKGKPGLLKAKYKHIAPNKARKAKRKAKK